MICLERISVDLVYVSYYQNRLSHVPITDL
jgi:hypothetical protein